MTVAFTKTENVSSIQMSSLEDIVSVFSVSNGPM
jgi:hypothetical protein